MLFNNISKYIEIPNNVARKTNNCLEVGPELRACTLRKV